MAGITAKFLADFEEFKASARSAEGSLKSLEGQGGKLAAAFDGIQGQLAGAFSVAGLMNFGREILAAGDTIQKMADQTGLGTAEVQKFMYIAGQSGTSIESLVGAVQNLQQRIGDENSGAAGAMAKLGIQSEKFNKLDTYEQMTTLGDAIKNIKDPTEQASAAAAVFGKNWKEILPAIKSGMKEVGEQAPIMADEVVKATDRIGDAQTRAKQQAIVWGAETVTAIEAVGFAFGDWMSRFNPEHLGVATSEILKMQAALNDPDGLQAALGKIKPVTMEVGDALTALGTLGPKQLAKIKLAEMDLTEAAEKSIEVNKQRVKDEEAAWKIEEDSIATSTALWNEHYRTVRDESATTVEQQKNAVHDWFDDQVAKIDYTAENWKNLYDALEVTAKDRLNAIDAALARTKDVAVETGDAAVSAFTEWNESIMSVTRALDGAIKSEKELHAERERGNSTQFDLSTESGRAAVPEGIRVWLHDGYSLAQAAQIDFLMRWGLPINANDPLFAQKGPRVPGFASGVENFAGGLALVGERGPELVNLPGGSDVIPMGRGGGMVNNFYLIDNSENLARKTAQMILAAMKRGKQLGMA
jgi:hypothetical protein